jgi:hypothetical protein
VEASSLLVGTEGLAVVLRRLLERGELQFETGDRARIAAGQATQFLEHDAHLVELAFQSERARLPEESRLRQDSRAFRAP